MKLFYWPSLIVASVVFASLFYQLIIPPTLGLADNGDFLRVSGPAGIYHEQATGSAKFEYFRRFYHYNKPSDHGYKTSHITATKIATIVDKLRADKDTFDITTLGLIQSLVISIAVYILMSQLYVKDKITFFLGAFFSVLVLTDTTHAVFLNSFFAESTGYTSFVLLIALLVFSGRGENAKIRDWGSMLLFYITLLFFCYAKAQYAVLAVPFCIVFVIVTRKKKFTFQLLSWLIAICVIAGAMNDITGRVHPVLNTANLYNLVFKEFLTWSDDPAATAKELGISEKYIEYAGTDAFNPKGGFRTKMLQRELNRIGRKATMKFMLNHPDCTFWILKRAENQIWQSRLKYMGNFTSDTGKEPQSQSYAFSLWSSFRESVFKPPIIFLGVLILLNTIFGIIMLLRVWGSKYEIIFLVQILFVIVWTSQIAISVLGDGTYEFAKHLFIGRIAGDCLFLYLAGIIIPGFIRVVRKSSFLPDFKKQGTAFAAGKHK